MLVFEGCKSFRFRIVSSFLSGKQVHIKKIREVDESPGLQDFEISFLRLIEKLSDGSSYLKLTQLSNSYFLLLLSEKLSDVLTTVF